MRKILLIVLLLLFDKSVFSQDFLNSESISLESNTMMIGYSDVVNSDFLQFAFAGGNWSKERHLKMMKKSKKHNLLFGHAESEMSIVSKSDSIYCGTSGSVSVVYSSIAHVNGLVDQDLLNLFFLGNSDKVGRRLDIGSTNIEFMRYRKLGVAIKPHNRRYTVRASIVEGSQYFMLSTYHSSFYTNDLGDSISGNVNLDFVQNNKPKNIGFAFDMDFRSNVAPIQSGLSLDLKIRDLGLIQWSNTYRSYNNEVAFFGVDLSDVFQNKDSVHTLNRILGSESRVEKNSWRLLPTRVELGINYFSEKEVNYRLEYMRFLSGKNYVFSLNRISKPYFMNERSVCLIQSLCYYSNGLMSVGGGVELRGNKGFQFDFCFSSLSGLIYPYSRSNMLNLEISIPLYFKSYTLIKRK